MTASTSDGKTIAIIAYLTFIGLIIAALINNSKRSDLGTYHIRNMIGISLLSTVITLLSWTGLLTLLTNVLFTILGVFWLIGLIIAVRGEKQEIPILGKYFQDWFKSI